MNDNTQSLRDRAADMIDDVRLRARDLATTRIEVAAGRSVLAAVILVAGLTAAGALWTWHVRAERDALWRERIAAASARVKGALLAGGRDAESMDRIALEAIRGTDDALTDAERGLRAAASIPSTTDCPRIPARCLGLDADARRLRDR